MRVVDLSGVFVPTTTPFDPVTGEVDRVGLRANLRALAEAPVGIVIGGSTGEALLLDEEERRQSLECARDVARPDRPLVMGTGAESTRTTIRWCVMAGEVGADAVLVQPPAFYKGAMTDEALSIHYRTVADASPVPVILYQVPLHLNTLEFSTTLVAQLAKHGNIVGIKDSRGSLDRVAELVGQTPDDFQVLVGSGAVLYGGLEVGAVGGILAVANLAPSEAAEIADAYARGDTSRAGAIQERIGPVHTGVVGGWGVPGVKAGVDARGLHGGDPRPPLRPISSRGREKVESIMRAAGLLPSD